MKAALADPSLTHLGLEVSAREVSAPTATPSPAFAGQVSLTGIDRPGLLYRLSGVLARYGLNIVCSPPPPRAHIHSYIHSWLNSWPRWLVLATWAMHAKHFEVCG